MKERMVTKFDIEIIGYCVSKISVIIFMIKA